MEYSLEVVKYNSEHYAFVKKCGDDLPNASDETQWYAMKKRVAIIDHNEEVNIRSGSDVEADKVQPKQTEENGCENEQTQQGTDSCCNEECKRFTGAAKLWMLMGINEHLRMLRRSEDAPRLWEEISRNVRDCCLKTAKVGIKEGQCLLTLVDYILEMTWWVKDCFFLFVFELCLVQKILNIMQQIYPTEIGAAWDTTTLANRKQLLKKFDNRFERLRRQCEDMDSMLESWPAYCKVGIKLLNSLRPRQMDAISQTTFSDAFSWMKMFEYRLKCHWSLFLRVQLTIFQRWFR